MRKRVVMAASVSLVMESLCVPSAMFARITPPRRVLKRNARPIARTANTPVMIYGFIISFGCWVGLVGRPHCCGRKFEIVSLVFGLRLLHALEEIRAFAFHFLPGDLEFLAALDLLVGESAGLFPRGGAALER